MPESWKEIEEKRESEVVERTCRAIKTRLIGRLSFHRAVISHGDLLWKPFKCQLIAVIVLEVRELLWYFRRPISGCLFGSTHWSNIVIQRGDRCSRTGQKKKRNAMRKTTFPVEIILTDF